jgi:hypothetical protein
MMRRYLCILVFFLLAHSAWGVELGTPRLSESRLGTDFFTPERLRTTAGMKYRSGALTMEPLVGLGYGARQFEASGFGTMLHKLHAEAGGKLSLPHSLYLSAAAKLPVYSYESSESLAPAAPPAVTYSRQEYDLLRVPGKNLSWTGEVGVHLGLGTDLTIFFDQNPLTAPMGVSGAERTEERLGTRFIIHFR